MPTYIGLCTFTDKGAETVREGRRRLDNTKRLLREAGCDLKAFYLTMGPYDLVVVVDAPSDEVLARVVLIMASAGNVRTTSLRAFGEAEYLKIIDSIPARLSDGRATAVR